MKAFLSIGSNMGDRKRNLSCAIQQINGLWFTRVEEVSPIYINPAQGHSGGEFYNAVVMVNTLLCPYGLLIRLQEIEKRLGRREKFNNSARTIDIDILLCENVKVDLPDLSIPHPKMFERDFVMAPLLEMDSAKCLNLNFTGKRQGVLCRW